METWSVSKPKPGTMESPTLDFSDIRRKFLDIPYASASPSQKLDILLPPEGTGPFPTLIFIHGGAFVFGSKRDTQFLQAIDGINRGYAVVTVEYRLGYEARFPAGLFDFKAAIRFLRAHAAEYMLDGSRFASCGDSGGGYYAVMAAATQGNPVFEDLSLGNADYSSSVQAVVSWFASIDMIVQEQELKKIGGPDPTLPNYRKVWLGANVSDIEGLMHFTNPLHFITPAFPPILIHHGSADKTVPCKQAYILEEKVREVCGKGRAELEIMKGYNHGGFDPRWNEPENIDKSFAFLDKHLK
jgi:acetyl esterase/lipase